MNFIPYNPNPRATNVGDCAIRAVAKATDQTWENAYASLAIEGFRRGDLPNSNHVWGAYLKSKGFKQYAVPDTCPDCYTIKDFANDHPKGMYVLSLDNHVAVVNDGTLFDSWDSSNEAINYYWAKEK